MQGGRELMKNEIEAMITDITATTAEALAFLLRGDQPPDLVVSVLHA